MKFIQLITEQCLMKNQGEIVGKIQEKILDFVLKNNEINRYQEPDPGYFVITINQSAKTGKIHGKYP